MSTWSSRNQTPTISYPTVPDCRSIGADRWDSNPAARQLWLRCRQLYRQLKRSSNGRSFSPPPRTTQKARRRVSLDGRAGTLGFDPGMQDFRRGALKAGKPLRVAIGSVLRVAGVARRAGMVRRSGAPELPRRCRPYGAQEGGRRLWFWGLHPRLRNSALWAGPRPAQDV